ncbi:MAG: hypothetical protein EZS28_051263, partial [Streblomastix strix]
NLSENIKSLGKEAFQGCLALEALSLPNKLTKIEDAAFQNCQSLKKLAIPSSVTNLGNYLFAGCTALQELSLPLLNKENGFGFGQLFGEITFESSREIKQIVQKDNIKTFFIPVSLEKVTILKTNLTNGMFSNLNVHHLEIIEYTGDIGDYAFYNCGSLENFVINSKTNAIGVNAFMLLNSLTDVSLPKTIKKVGKNAFNSCFDLQAVHLSATFNQFNVEDWYNCAQMREITVDSNNATYEVIDGLLVNRPENTIVFCPAGLTKKEIMLSDSIKAIGPMAFRDCPYLEKFTGNEQLVQIGDSAFQNCQKLNFFEVPLGIKRIGEKILEGCE